MKFELSSIEIFWLIEIIRSEKYKFYVKKFSIFKNPQYFFKTIFIKNLIVIIK